MMKINEKKLDELFIVKRWTLSRISEYFGCCNITIIRRLKKLGLSREKISLVEDLTGRRFYSLVILSYVKNDKFGKAIWKVRCDCGKEKNINASGMKAGIVKSCGCYKRRKLSKGYKDISGSWWRKLQKSAVVRGYDFDITIEEVWGIFVRQNKKCALSAVDLVMFPNNDKYYLQTASLDRIDSTKGYYRNNVQWVHKRVNFLKRNYPEEELLYWSSKIVKNKGFSKDIDKQINYRETRRLNENITNIKTS